MEQQIPIHLIGLLISYKFYGVSTSVECILYAEGKREAEQGIKVSIRNEMRFDYTNYVPWYLSSSHIGQSLPHKPLQEYIRT